MSKTYQKPKGVCDRLGREDFHVIRNKGPRHTKSRKAFVTQPAVVILLVRHLLKSKTYQKPKGVCDSVSGKA